MQPAPISMEKFFEMFGRVSLERDLLAAENGRLKEQMAQAADFENKKQESPPKGDQP